MFVRWVGCFFCGWVGLRGLWVVHYGEDGFGGGGDFARGILFLFGRDCWDLFRFFSSCLIFSSISSMRFLRCGGNTF